MKSLILKTCTLGLVVWLLPACQRGTNDHGVKISDWDKTWVKSTKVFPADKRTNFMSLYTTVYNENNNEYVVRVNELTNHLQFYLKNKLEFEVNYDYAGPNGVGKLKAAYVLSRDSIILMPFYSNHIFLGDAKGTVYKRLHFPPEKMINGTYGFLVAFTPTPIIKRGNKIYVHVSQFYNFCDPKYYSEFSPVLAELDLTSGAITNIMPFPEEYKTKGWTVDHIITSHAYNPNKGEIYVSFPATPYIYVYDVSKKTTIKKRLDTKRIDNIDFFTEFECRTYDGARLVSESLRMSFYGFCVYAPAKKRLYRFYHLPADENIKINNEDNNPDTRLCAHRTGLLIADDEMNILADVLLPDYTYNVYDFFVTEEGLWLSRHNFFRKDKREDVMEFDLIRY